MRKKLIMTMGLPASGKSTWAKEEKTRLKLLGIDTVIVNKDEIRKAHTLTGWTWSPEGEKEILTIRDSCIKGAFAHGATVVISSDTNFGRHKNNLERLARSLNASFEVKSFLEVPVETCIQRDDARNEGKVGPEVIKKMYNQYVATNEPIEPVPYIKLYSKNPAIICDLDGTLALHNGRSPYDFSKCDTDLVNEPVAGIISTYAKQFYDILYVSGRDDSCKAKTEKWLLDNRLPYGSKDRDRHKLWMRETGDQRKDDQVKLEIFNKHIRDNYYVKFVLDDRDRVVKLWRDLGLACFQVNYGAF